MVQSGYANPELESALQQAVDKLVRLRAVELVTGPDRDLPAYYSRLFLRPKSNGGWRPIIDLKMLNPFVGGVKQKQESQQSIRASLTPNTWTFSIDLRDAFFHIPIHKKSRHLLRFCYKGVIYQYRALPFGLKTAPWVFTRVVSQVQGMEEMADVLIHIYLDDWLVPTESFQVGSHQAQALTQLCSELGLLINVEKSRLVPGQVFIHLGATYNLAAYTVTLTEENFQKVVQAGLLFLKYEMLPARLWLSLIGLLNSQEKFSAFGRLRVRDVQWALKLQWKASSQDLTFLVRVTRDAQVAITWWMDAHNFDQGTPIRLPAADVTLQTDASTSGWGGHAGVHAFHGIWSSVDREKHINVLEMMAVRMSLTELKPPAGSVVLVNTDNTTTMYYINKQGGVRSWSLFQETKRLLLMAESQGWKLVSKHVPGKLNILADQLSRRYQVLQTEWKLHSDAVHLLFDRWGRPQVDLFATRYNYQLPTFVSPVPDELAWEVDALSITWNGLSAYAFPPHRILPQVLEKVRKASGLRLILVVPFWERHPWLKEIRQLAVDGPVHLPGWPNLLKQPRSGLLHHNPALLRLSAWLLQSSPC